MKYNKRILVLSLFAISVILLQSISLAGARPPIIDPPPGGTTTYRVYGYVKTTSGSPISGARANIYTDRGTYLGYDYTDSSGYFTKYVTCSPPDFFKIVVTKSGYDTKTIYKQYSGTTCYCGTIYLSGSSTTYNIYGNVITSDTSLPVSGATVELYRNVYEGWSLITTRTTDSNGHYQYTYSTTSAMSQCRVVASASGYNPGSNTVSVSSTTVNMGDVMVFAPATTYTVSGVVVDAYTGSDVCYPTVEVRVYYSNNWFTLGEADTNPNDGGFTFSYTCYDDWEAVSITISKEYYEVREETIWDSTTTSYDFGNVGLFRSSLPHGITSVDLGYDEEPLQEFWESSGTLSPTLSSDGDSVTITDSGQGGEGGSSYAAGHIDLWGWTGLGDLRIQVSVRARSDIAIATLFQIGLTSYSGDTGNPLWLEEEILPLSTDTGFITITKTIHRVVSSGDNGIQVPDMYTLFWGYIDGSYEDILQRVSMDYYIVTGDGFPVITTADDPDGILYQNRAGTTYHPDTHQFEFGSSDVDTVNVVHCGSIEATTLGICSDSSPTILATISISLPADEYRDIGDDVIIIYNLVDRVTITLRVFSYDSGNYEAPAPGVIDIQSVKLNVDDGSTPGASAAQNGLESLVLEAIGLIPGAGPYLKFASHTLLWVYDCTMPISDNQLTINDVNPGYASATFDFGGPVELPPPFLEPPKGSTDFKMTVVATLPNLNFDSVYKVCIDYEVVMKDILSVSIQESLYPDYTERFSDPIEYSKSFNLFFFDENKLDRLHVVGTKCSESGHSISLTAQSGTTIYDTIYGEDWKLVKFDTPGGTVTVSASSSQFIQMEVRYWREGEQRVEAFVYTTYNLQYTLVSETLFYEFKAVYS